MSGNEQLRQWEPQTVRTFLIRVAGKLLTGADQLRIKLPREPLQQPLRAMESEAKARSPR